MTDRDEHRWLIEQDDGYGEIRVHPHTNERLIAEALATPYAALFDKEDESCVWCIGEPDRRIVEIRLCTDRSSCGHGVVAIESSSSETTTLQADEHLLTVSRNEVLTRIQAEQVFLEFFRTKAVPKGFTVLQKRYLFD